MRALVTGGGGFVGSRLVERLESDGHEVFVARRREFDLTTMDGAARLFDEAHPELVFHLAAEVGGIGANRANPGRYWYANLMMGAHVLEQSRLHEVEKLVIAGTVCIYPKFTPVPFREDELWNGFPEETNAPYGVAKKAVLVGAQAYREQYGLRTAYLLPANLYGPGDNFDLETSHVIPALIRKMVDSNGRGRALGRRVAEPRVPLRRRLRRRAGACGRALRGRRDGQPRHRRGDDDPRARGDDRRPDRLRGRDRLGHVDAERAAAPLARRFSSRRSCSGSGRGRHCATASSAPSRGTARRRRHMRRADLPRLLERPWQLLAVAVALYWLTALVIGLRADASSSAPASWSTSSLLGPLSLALAYRIGKRIAGAALGAWTLLVWVALPWLAPLFTLASYDATLRYRVLPLAVGLTPDGGYLEGVALLAALALLLERRRSPSPPAVSILATLTVVWLSRLPVPDLSLDTFKANMAGLREYFWSHRVLQWIPIAGVVAVARRSPPAALALGCWLGGYVIFRAAQAGDRGRGRRALPGSPPRVSRLRAAPRVAAAARADAGRAARTARASGLERLR